MTICSRASCRDFRGNITRPAAASAGCPTSDAANAHRHQCGEISTPTARVHKCPHNLRRHTGAALRPAQPPRTAPPRHQRVRAIQPRTPARNERRRQPPGRPADNDVIVLGLQAAAQCGTATDLLANPRCFQRHDHGSASANHVLRRDPPGHLHTLFVPATPPSLRNSTPTAQDSERPYRALGPINIMPAGPLGFGHSPAHKQHSSATASPPTPELSHTRCFECQAEPLGRGFRSA